MLRWICLFALLANALLLLWYSVQAPRTVPRLESHSSDIDTLRLVGEINPQSLVWLSGDSDVSSCVEFDGFKSRVKAGAVKRFVYEQGFASEIDEVRVQVERNHKVIVVLPAELNKRMEVIDYLESSEGLESEEMFDFEYVIAGFKGRAEAEEKLMQLKAAKIKARIEFEQVSELRFRVRVFEYIDRKLSNEIKEVVVESYSVEKNEKKVCQRVASIRSTE
ncbi:hypothetical protein [Neptuniibacter sp. 1_MG-2023]|jgi:hypothetical protein|uniref:hypothetical protein n=1 Tax=Neptuniibacter sp. 1_MG-2023 TaxID=3062662 RepID=UPI0026E179F1|nr:hypothetical protein [Neptuniibacter sp. 1_MG-2023]MDO6594486.1 hypothetical protein [Neptuniibacter sp. 1_MG-2023]